ncbi:shieldin complex subunit 1 [Terrapene carolina triunguis]|uniref:shieldin complex subunit 1 n=1 Tax=Terrapene triunguis TaxID=2587831 RepID=UPI000E774D27|nr:shieldin complex subunit 1 [Terrapene carolina triunguis]
MEGDETASSHPSEDSSILDLPSAYDITDSFLLEHNTGTSDEPCSSVDTFASSACLERDPNKFYPKAVQIVVGVLNHLETLPGCVAFFLDMSHSNQAWKPEWCICSLKIQDLANKEGGKYSLCSLHMAQMVLNRDGCKVFPNHSSNAGFSAPANGEVALEEGKRTPGLSDDVLQFLLKQNVMKS